MKPGNEGKQKDWKKGMMEERTKKKGQEERKETK